MPLWDKVKTEIDRAGRIAQDALDEGKIRIDLFRARQHGDKAAQALGYAIFRARQGGIELDADTYTRLSAALAEHEKEIARLEAQMESLGRETAEAGGDAPTGSGPTAA